MARKPTHEELKQRVKELENESLAHKETEKAARSNEEKVAGIISSITDHMSMMDDKHNIVWANNVAKKLFGTDLVGKKCYRTYHGYDSPCEPCVVRKCFENGGVHEHETVVTREDGGEMVFWCVASVAERHSDGQPKTVVEISRDITERKKAEDKLRQAHDELEGRVRVRTLELEASNIELRNQHEELLKQKLETEKLNKELLETNKAISVLARNIDKKRAGAEKGIALNISSKIIPIVEQLRTDKTLERRRTELDVLAACLYDITSSLTDGMNEFISLSPSEMTVAAMINNGLTSREITERLRISLETVKTHRRNIRKKLGINNSKFNLTNYLRLKWIKDGD